MYLNPAVIASAAPPSWAPRGFASISVRLRISMPFCKSIVGLIRLMENTGRFSASIENSVGDRPLSPPARAALAEAQRQAAAGALS